MSDRMCSQCAHIDVSTPFSPSLAEARLKFEASMMMLGDGIVVPTYAEWVGLNMKIRDDEFQDT